MRIHTAAMALLALFAAALAAGADGPRLEAVVRDITVFDARTGEWRPHQDILIDATRVQAVRPHEAPPVRAKYVIEGAGSSPSPVSSSTCRRACPRPRRLGPFCHAV